MFYNHFVPTDWTTETLIRKNDGFFKAIIACPYLIYKNENGNIVHMTNQIKNQKLTEKIMNNMQDKKLK